MKKSKAYFPSPIYKSKIEVFAFVWLFIFFVIFFALILYYGWHKLSILTIFILNLIIFILFYLLEFQLSIKIFEIYEDKISISYPISFYKKPILIFYKDIVSLTFKEVPGPGAGQDPRIIIKYKDNKKKIYLFMSAEKDIQKVIDTLREQGIKVQVETESNLWK